MFISVLIRTPWWDKETFELKILILGDTGKPLNCFKAPL